jgi:nicotinic acid mononucleotide adenylyltransferase
VASFRGRFSIADERLVALAHPRLAISSTEIRARVRAGRSIRYLVPDPVAALVAEYALYVGDSSPAATPAGP